MENPIEVTLLKNLILDNLDNFLCVVWDEKGEILFPNDITLLKKYGNIICHPTLDSSIYFLENEKKWFKKVDKTINYNNCTYTLAYFYDITEHKEIEQVLQKDYITGISNRANAIEKINEYIKHAIEYEEEFAIALGDVDYFKQINDTYGHLFGDIVLKNIGELIIKNIRTAPDRDCDIAGRFGGDEFFGLIKNISLEDSYKWKENADYLAKRIIHTSNDKSISLTNISMSIGIYHVSKETLEYMLSKNMNIDQIRQEIYLRCDENLYIAKEERHKNISSEKSLSLKKYWTLLK